MNENSTLQELKGYIGGFRLDANKAMLLGCQHTEFPY
jgi:hypothetical protein